MDLANQIATVGEALSNSRLVSKVLACLPEKFHPKVAFIESKPNLPLNEVISELEAWEMTYANKPVLKNRGIALQAQFTEFDLEDELQFCEDGMSRMLEADQYNALVASHNTQVRMGTNRFKNTKPKEMRNWKPQNKNPAFNKTTGFANKSSREEFKKNAKCHACSGYGHYANECANTLKKKGLGLWASLSDEKTRVTVMK